MLNPRFLTIDEIITIHDLAIQEYGGTLGIRDKKLLESSIGAPKSSFGGHFLMNLFEMASTYIVSITMNHPFQDGNKRTAAAVATIFLLYNGYLLYEKKEEELADKILDLIEHKIDKKEITRYFEQNCKEE